MNSQTKNAHAMDRKIDEANEESFPASDAPSFVGAGAAPGGPMPRRKRRNRWGVDYGSSSYLTIRH